MTSKLDNITDKFQYIYHKNSNNLKKEGEAERALNLMRGVLRLCVTLNRNPEALNNSNFCTWFIQSVQENQDIPAIK